MAPLKMSTLALVTVFALAGLSHGQDKACSTDQVTVLSKMVTCITKDHPEYFFTVFTKMGDPAAMESPEFMCSNPDMMVSLVHCFLQYVQGCMPPGVASQVATVMPTPKTVKRGVNFLCSHKADFEQTCVMSHLQSLVECIGTKMEAFSSTAPHSTTNMQDALCSALRMEEQCLAKNLKSCPNKVTSDLKYGLLAFFPAEKCNIDMSGSNKVLTNKVITDRVLRFQRNH